MITEMLYVEILLPQAFFIIVCYSDRFKDYFNLFMLKQFRFFLIFNFVYLRSNLQGLNLVFVLYAL